jgi:hypothetical protein
MSALLKQLGHPIVRRGCDDRERASVTPRGANSTSVVAPKIALQHQSQ